MVEKTRLGPAPAMEEGGMLAPLFWWDGCMIPKNLDGDPD